MGPVRTLWTPCHDFLIGHDSWLCTWTVHAVQHTYNNFVTCTCINKFTLIITLKSPNCSPNFTLIILHTCDTANPRPPIKKHSNNLQCTCAQINNSKRHSPHYIFYVSIPPCKPEKILLQRRESVFLVAILAF